MECNVQIRPGRTIHLTLYENTGSDTTIFLIHGFGGSSHQWREQINELKKKYSLVIPDLFGHGQSDKPRDYRKNPYSFSELDQDLQALFNHYSGDNNIIIGHSYGGALATSLALEHQDKVKKLILLSPTPCIPSMSLPFFLKFPTFILELLRSPLDKHFQQLAFTKNADPKLIAAETAAGFNNPMYVIQQVAKGMQDIPEIDLCMLNIPVLIVTGTPDGLVSPDGQKNFYKNLPQHEFAIIEDASHMALLERPDMVNQHISRFLE